LCKKGEKRVQLLGCGSILNEVIAAQTLLLNDFNIGSDIWSVTSFTELRREGLDVERYNTLNPEKTPKVSYVEEQLKETEGPVIAATDYMKLFADQIRPFIKDKHYLVLGTDGYGRSDSRETLRSHFEVDRYYIAYTAIKALVDEGQLEQNIALAAIEKYAIKQDKLNPALA